MYKLVLFYNYPLLRIVEYYNVKKQFVSGIITSKFKNYDLLMSMSVPSLSLPTLWFSDGIPSDGIPIEEVVTVSVALTVVYVISATAGLVFAVACLLFTLLFRQKK